MRGRLKRTAPKSAVTVKSAHCGLRAIPTPLLDTCSCPLRWCIHAVERQDVQAVVVAVDARRDDEQKI